MIVYRSLQRPVSTRETLGSLCLMFREIERSSSPCLEDVRRLLIEFGVFESALADALAGDIAIPCEESRLARNAAVALGRVFANRADGRPIAPHLEKFGRALADLAGLLLPSRIRISVPEGYAYYGLFPDTYLAAADDFYNQRTPQRAVVIGIRSIGTSLSAAVAGRLEERGCRVRSYTVRPGSHPWDRKLRTADVLDRDWQSQAGSEFIIVDEGPGISGSSFGAVAGKLSSLGIPDARVSFFPSWDAPADRLSNENARRCWQAHRRFVGTSSEPWLDGMRDLSAGAWRDLVFDGREHLYPAVHPHHESRKYLAGSGVLLKFAGLGPYGEWKLDRQRWLASAGFSPKALGITQGFIATEWVPGAPLSARDLSRLLIDRIAAYLAFRATSFPAERGLSFDSVLEMIQLNTRELIGHDAPVRNLRRLASLYDSRPAVEIDGRMMPHEWIASPDGILKTDAVDHHAGHFYPGCADILWDLAGASVEFGMDDAASRTLVDRYTSHSGDRVPITLFAFYRLAYLAFRGGYASMALDAVTGTPDFERFSSVRFALACFLQSDLAAVTSERRLKVPA